MSEEITFTFERFYDGIDLASKKLWIYYIRPNDNANYQEELFIIPDSHKEKNDIKYFSATWSASEIATMYSGVLTFALVAKGDGYKDTYLWQSYPSNFTIEKGIFKEGSLKDSDFQIVSPSKQSQEIYDSVQKLNTAYENGTIIKWQSLALLMEKIRNGGLE